jgi:hypothetical protein
VVIGILTKDVIGYFVYHGVVYSDPTGKTIISQGDWAKVINWPHSSGVEMFCGHFIDRRFPFTFTLLEEDFEIVKCSKCFSNVNVKLNATGNETICENCFYSEGLVEVLDKYRNELGLKYKRLCGPSIY